MRKQQRNGGINARKCKDLSNVTRYIGKAGIRMSLTAAKDCADVHSCILGLHEREGGQGMENHVNGFRQIAENARKMRSEPEQRTKGMMITLVSLENGTRDSRIAGRRATRFYCG